MKEITRSISGFLLLGLLVLSCQKTELSALLELSECQLEAPIDELQWLQDTITAKSESACKESIHQYDFREGTVFVIRCGIESFCLCEAPEVLNCEGELLFMLDKSKAGMSESDFLAETSNERLIWEND